MQEIQQKLEDHFKVVEQGIFAIFDVNIPRLKAHVETPTRQIGLVKILVGKLEKSIAKLKRNLILCRVPVEEHLFPFANFVNETFEACEHYINSHVQCKSS